MSNLKKINLKFDKWILLWFLPPYWLWRTYLMLHHAIKGPFEEKATVNQPLKVKNKKHFAIIGCGLSGIQALKECYAQGHDATCMDQAGGIGGLWRYRTSTDLASVYDSTHIDTGRDLNSYGDFPMDVEKPLLLHNSVIAKYLKDNVERFDLYKNIRLRTRVTKITPYKFDPSTRRWSWKVERETLPLDFDADGEKDLHPELFDQPGKKRSEIFDGIFICTGRHSKPVIPEILGRETFKGFQCHSAYYKLPSLHQLENKTIIVVGIGNSGVDIATELGPIAKKVHLVSRSGAWVFDFKGTPGNHLGFGDRFQSNFAMRLPWQWEDKTLRRVFAKGHLGDQTLLDEAGLKPIHGPWQAHPTITGLSKGAFHNEIQKQHIKVHRQINKITESGVYFDQDKVETPVDAIIWATGFKQSIDCLDPTVINLAFDRNDDNQVTLYKMIWPISEYQHSICFINFVQSASFVAADLQVRAFFKLFNYECQLPDLETQFAEVEAVKKSLASQFIDRPRHHIQAGISLKYYDDLARFIGCYPSIGKIFIERPSALWHAWFTPVTALNYRLVGPGKLQDAEREILKRKEALWVSPALSQNKMPYLVQIALVMISVIVAKCLGYYVGSKQYQPEIMREFLKKNKPKKRS